MPHVVADTDTLVADGVISPEAAGEIGLRSRAIMIRLAINAILCLGIVSATGGLIFWLADAAWVAGVGMLFLLGGLALLSRLGADYAMLGNAAALIGAGMLVGGASIELIDKYEDLAGWVMLPAGALIAGVAARALLKGGLTARFVAGSILLMGLAMHLVGFGLLLQQSSVDGLPKAMFFLYAASLIAGAGWVTDVRLITALAIVPFAQVFDTGTSYFHAVYVFFSPESTLSILQMALLMAALAWFGGGWPERTARHARVLSIMAFVVANLCALVGSLWGDYVGETIWGPGAHGWDYAQENGWDAWNAAREAFQETALYISEQVYSVLWAVALAGLVLWAAHRGNRGLFNAGLTFGGIHAYTQLFESFGDEPLAYVIGGLVAIPAAWIIWRLNQRWEGAQS